MAFFTLGKQNILLWCKSNFSEKKINKKQAERFCCCIKTTFISSLFCGWLLRALCPDSEILCDTISGAFLKKGEKNKQPTFALHFLVQSRGLGNYPRTRGCCSSPRPWWWWSVSSLHHTEVLVPHTLTLDSFSRQGLLQFRVLGKRTCLPWRNGNCSAIITLLVFILLIKSFKICFT